VRRRSQFDVILTAAGDKRIQVIRSALLTSLGLKEARTWWTRPKPVVEKANKEDAEKRRPSQGAGHRRAQVVGSGSRSTHDRPEPVRAEGRLRPLGRARRETLPGGEILDAGGWFSSLCRPGSGLLSRACNPVRIRIGFWLPCLLLPPPPCFWLIDARPGAPSTAPAVVVDPGAGSDMNPEFLEHQ